LAVKIAGGRGVAVAAALTDSLDRVCWGESSGKFAKVGIAVTCTTQVRARMVRLDNAAFLNELHFYRTVASQ